MKFLFRLFDLGISIIILPLLLPLSILISLLLLVFQGRPIIFKSERIGQFGQKFYLYKFRSMKNNTINTAKENLQNPYDRITSIGKFIRISSLDELPQIINVVKNEMSLVGYRPGTPDQFELNQLRYKYKVFDNKPGITGLAQVTFRDKYPNLLSKVKKDAEYYQKKTIFSYFVILLKTLIISLTFKNINF